MSVLKILAIETSADETAVAILDASGDRPENLHFKVLGSAILSQITKHVPYGGIYPNFAHARAWRDWDKCRHTARVL